MGSGGGKHGFYKLIMAVHTLHTKQIIRATRQEAWDFFSNPRNLAKITPPELGFEIISPDLPPFTRWVDLQR